MTLSRRKFIKIGGAAVGAAAAGSALTTNLWGLTPNRMPDPKTDGDRVVPTFCEMCFWKCGVLAHVKSGRVTKIVGNPEHPLSHGRLCPRGTGGTGLLYDPDRLKKPLHSARGARHPGVRRGELGRGAGPRRGKAHRDQEEVRARSVGGVHPRLRRLLVQSAGEGLRHREPRGSRPTRSAAAPARSRSSSPTGGPSARPRCSTSRTAACSR